jgi:hypothetical protein
MTGERGGNGKGGRKRMAPASTKEKKDLQSNHSPCFGQRLFQEKSVKEGESMRAPELAIETKDRGCDK